MACSVTHRLCRLACRPARPSTPSDCSHHWETAAAEAAVEAVGGVEGVQVRSHRRVASALWSLCPTPAAATVPARRPSRRPSTSSLVRGAAGVTRGGHRADQVVYLLPCLRRRQQVRCQHCGLVVQPRPVACEPAAQIVSGCPPQLCTLRNVTHQARLRSPQLRLPGEAPMAVALQL